MKYKKTVLPDGLRIITIPMPDSPSVTVDATVEVGSLYETKEQNGIAHLLEHMVFKGTTKRPKAIDISKELDSIGASYNASTGHNTTSFYAKAASHHLEKLLDIISDMYTNPIFDPKELEKEKGVIIEEIRMYEDYPNEKVYDISQELMYGDQPAGRGIPGTAETVRSFTREGILEFRNKYYVREATTIVVSGAFDEATIIDKVKKYFALIKNGEPKKRDDVKVTLGGPTVVVANKDVDQTHIIVSFHGLNSRDPRRFAQSVLLTVLGGGMSSRLFSKMRDDLGICYYIYTGASTAPDHGSIRVSAGVDSNRLEQAVRGILEECERLCHEAVGEEEMVKAKESMAGRLLLSLETSDGRSDFFGSQECLNHEILTPAEIIANIKKVTSKEVMDIAKELFVDTSLYFAAVGRSVKEDEVKRYMRFR